MWKVRHKPTYSQGMTWSKLVLAVEYASAKGSKLVVQLPQDHPGNWIGEPIVPVFPSNVEFHIREALRFGWQPLERGKVFQMIQTAR
jgi:hypothetical protein